MFVNTLLNIINEEIKTQLIETPDNIIVGNKQYWLHENGVFPFALEGSTFEVVVGEESTYHSDNYDDDGDGLDDLNKYRYAGRLFSTPKVITLWEYPTQKSITYKMIKDLEEIIGISILNNGWRIEVFNSSNDNDSNFISVDEYFSSEIESKDVADDLRQQHVMSPTDPRKKKSNYAGGSKMTASDQPNNLAWRMALRQEGTNLDDLINNEIIELITESIIKEFYEDPIYDLYDERDEIMRNTIVGFMESKVGIDRQFWQLISFPRLKKIWEDAARMGFVRDEKGLDMIKKQMITNMIKLDVNTELMGHSEHFPEEELEDAGRGYTREEFDEKMNDSNDVYFTDPKSGQWRLSDYGLKPLWDIALNLAKENDHVKQIMYIDQMLNVVHMRSDLASWFVQGGSTALSQLSGQYHDE